MTYQEKINKISIRRGNVLGGSTCADCTKSYCCEHQVEVGIGEAEFDKIAHLVTSEQIARAGKEIVKLTNGTAIVCNSKPTYRCPFLSEEGQCEIYENRFMICASYSVISPEEDCSASLCTPGSQVSIVAPEGIFTEFMMDHPEGVDDLLPLVESEPTDVLIEFKKRYLRQ